MDDKRVAELYHRFAKISRILQDIQKLEAAAAAKSTTDNSTDVQPTKSSRNKSNNEARSSKDDAKKTDEDQKNTRQTSSAKRFGPVNVFVHAQVLKMGEIDTHSQKFTCELRIVSRWLAPEHNGKTAEWKDKKPTSDWNHWHPQSMIQNSCPGLVEDVTYVVLFDVSGSAMVEESRLVRGLFNEKLELYDYPFDTQELSVNLVSALPLNAVCFNADPVIKSTVCVSTFVQRQEWKLRDAIKVEANTYRDQKVRGKPEKSMVVITCKAKRHFAFFIWNVIALMILISGLSFSTFAIDCASLPNRLPLSFLMLLSNTTFKFAVSKSIPKVCYLTYLDQYVLISMTLMVILCFWHTTISIVARGYSKQFVNRVDYAAMAVFCVAYILFFAVFIAKTKFTVRRSMKRKEKQEKMREKELASTHGRP